MNGYRKGGNLVRNLEAEERETTVTSTDGDDVVKVWTAQRRFITRLRHRWNPATGAKRASGLSEEQKAASAARLAASRGALSGVSADAPPGQRDEQARTHAQVYPR